MVFRNEFIEKLGNGLRLILTEFGATNKTSILKLLYFIDEKAVLKSGRPVFNLEYKVWQYGPVNQELYVELSEGAKGLLDGYITLNSAGNFICNGTFVNDEFSDFEVDLITAMCQTLKEKKAFELVVKSHEEGGLWHETALRNNLLESFTSKTKSTSDVMLDLGELVNADPMLKSRFQAYQETISAF